MCGNLGYELDLTNMSDEDKAAVKQQVADYKQIRGLSQYGKFYTLKAPLDSNQAAWMTVSDDQNEAVVTTVNIMSYAQPYLTKTKLAGLDPDKNYEDLATGKVYGGDELMNLGLYDPTELRKDFTAKMYHFKAIAD